MKDYIYKRVDHFKKPWFEYLYPALLVYNKKSIHSTTKHTPVDGRKPENEFSVKLNLLLHKFHARKYPPLHGNDKVKIYKNKDLKHKKERYSVGSQSTYEIEDEILSMGQSLCEVKGQPRKLFMRHELLKV